MRVFIGWDERDVLAYQVCVESLAVHASIEIDVTALKDWELRAAGLYRRRYEVDETGQKWDRGVEGAGIVPTPFSTGFSFTRFLVPAIMEYADDWCLFVDADVMWRADIAELVELADDRFAVMCVQHNHEPVETVKMGGLRQTRYRRKNWSSMMLINPSRCLGLTADAVNRQTGAWLHGMDWLDDALIGALHPKWNWLDGHSDSAIDPALMHYTRGTPDMPGCSEYRFAREFWSYAT